MTDWTDGLHRARAHAPFLARALDRRPDIAEMLARGEVDAAMALVRSSGTVADTGVALRRERLALSLVVAIADLAGAYDLTQVVTALTDFADRALDAAIGAAIRRRVPDAPSVGLSGIALGKMGARELNYSSDIDPILLFDPETLPRRDRDDPAEAAQMAARHIVDLLSTITAEGHVFRVDLRLCPQSEITPLALSFGAAITHYESSALAWERAAFIRARAASGDIAAAQSFLDTIRPFVWRRSLDFGAIAEIARLTTRIRDHYAAGQAIGPGYDLKRGRGGIREVEFFAQTYQLIHGGRNPALRLRGTRASLDALADAAIIPPDDARVLGESYDRLRTIEHRLQMVGDKQTHSLPTDAGALDTIAALDGTTGAALVAELAAISDQVGTRFDALIATLAPRGAVALADQPLARELRELGFAEPDALATRIEGWGNGKFRALRSEAAREAFAQIRAPLLRALAAAPDQARALLRWEQLIEHLPSAINIFRLLEARPALFDVVMRVLAHAPLLADDLARRADLLDALIDRTAFDLPGDVPAIAARLSRTEKGDDYQCLLDAVRRRVGEMRFALGVQLIEQAHGALAIANALSRVAEATIDVLTTATEAEFAGVHGHVPDSRLVILGLGRLGGGALTHASDLDLIFLFSGDYAHDSDGPRPLGGTLYYTRLCQRVTAALSAPTAAGALYDVDTRLRPSGTQGPIAVTLDSFARYQREEAWTWEHMALCRARVVHGNDADRAALAAIIDSVLTMPRDPAALRADVLKMRGEMARHKPPRGPMDVKLARGGLVDAEFIVHYLQLRERTAFNTDLGLAISALADAGLVPHAMRVSHDLLARLLVVVRLMAPDGAFPPEASRAIVAHACGEADWDHLIAAIAAARAAIAATWQTVFCETLET